AEPKVGDARIQGKPGVLIALLSQFGANTLETTRRLEGVLADLKPSLEAQGIQLFPPLFRPASFIETAVHNIGHSLLLGAVFVVAVLFLFMFNLRAAFISITAIPLSLLVAIIVLDRWGLTLNTITLGGLAIALGVVVDDAVIDVENIYRRLRENAASPEPRSNFRVVLDASLEVRSAVVYATFVVALVFLPVLSMSGLQGRLFAPLGLAYILAVMTSLGVALTITPALCMVLLPRRARTAREPRPIRGMKAGYRRLLLPLMRYPGAVIGPVLLFCAIAALLLHRFGAEFLPEFREGHFVLHINTIPGSSLQESGRVGSLIAAELLKDKRIQTVPQQIGRAELGEDAWGPHRSESHTQLAPNTTAKEQDQVEDFIRQTLKSFPGITFDVTTFLGDRIGETISGETAQVVVSVFGEDLDALDQKAREVADVLAGIRGNADVLVASPPGAPQLAIQLRPERLLQFGFQPTQVLDAMQTAYQGTRVAQTYEGSRVFDVAVILDEQYRRDPEDVRGLLLRSPDGVLVPLSELADVYLTTGRYTVLHDGARRRQTVTCNVRGRDVASFVAEAKQKVAAQVRFPGGVYPIFTGAAEARAQARNELFVHSSIAGLGIVLLLAMVFGSLRNLLLVLVNLPLAFVGGVVAAYFSGGNLSLGSLVGFVTLFGITTRNSIMMISHYDHLVREEGMLWGLDAALRGASERIVPILMTALVTALGLLPIALGSGEAGREIEGPMAIVILGGLATSTLLNLLVLPTLALRFGRFGRRTEMDD
ncbi:MAG TPA: efflux RND transporter permease subunit, partial [Phycisphaerae bacterium]